MFATAFSIAIVLLKLSSLKTTQPKGKGKCRVKINQGSNLDFVTINGIILYR